MEQYEVARAELPRTPKPHAAAAAVMFFAACVLDHDLRLRVMASYVERAAKRLFGIPDFKYYALADGMSALLTRNPGPPVTRLSPKEPRQLHLFAFVPIVNQKHKFLWGMSCLRAP